MHAIPWIFEALRFEENYEPTKVMTLVYDFDTPLSLLNRSLSLVAVLEPFSDLSTPQLPSVIPPILRLSYI